MKETKDITKREYGLLQEAYNHFNKKLFGNTLPECLITLNRRSNCNGYFIAGRFRSRDGKTMCDEIALNPDVFSTVPDIRTFATLVHEMCHLWQHHQGRSPRRTYHDAEWGKKMESIGLIPSHTGEPGGHKTGQKMTHYIQENGLYERTGTEFIERGNVLRWESFGISLKKETKNTKIKYTCPVCKTNVWGKDGLNIVCGDCEETMEVM